MLGNQSFHGGASETPVRSSIPNSNQTASTRGGCLAMEARVLRLHARQIGKLVNRLEQPFVRILPGSEEFEQRIQLRSICKRFYGTAGAHELVLLGTLTGSTYVYGSDPCFWRSLFRARMVCVTSPLSLLW